MANRSEGSLLAGRGTEPLDERLIRAVSNTFLGLDDEASFAYDEQGRTRFVVEKDDDGVDQGQIYFGPDVFPGPSVLDPNSALSMKAAVAHELSHFHRWNDRTELPVAEYTNLDEALTSLDAALRYASDLSAHEVQQLIRDAMQRLSMLHQELRAP